MDVGKIADKVLDAGDRTFWKDDYEKRVDVFAEEMAKIDPQSRAALVKEILHDDDGAFGSWMTADRINALEKEGRITSQEKSLIMEGFAEAAKQGTLPPVDFVQKSHDPKLIAAYMNAQDMTKSDGIKDAMQAFSGLNASDMKSFITDKGNAKLMQKFELAVQTHQREFEQETTDVINPGLIFNSVDEADIQFSKDQLVAMREAFKMDDKMFTNGELLLAYPDPIERNEQVTKQYYELSNGMAGILGKDNANWATYAVWASDEIGRNLDSGTNKAVEQSGIGDPRFWLSQGNSKLVSDIGPAFRHFVDTFGGGKNRDMSFEKFWSGFESKYAGRNISYLEGKVGNPDDMKNAFKAYYDSMKIQDQLKTADPAKQADLKGRQEQLMLYGNTLVGLQEQFLVQEDIENGLKVLGITNPWGAGSGFVDLHTPGAGGKGERKLDTDIDLTPQSTAANGKSVKFVTADGKTIDIQTELRARLEGLDGNNSNEQEWNIKNSGTDHWENYGQRMGYIYHLFAEFQHDKNLFNDPRVQFGTRATPLKTQPDPIVLPSYGFGG
jgi:hypothetical protein